MRRDRKHLFILLDIVEMSRTEYRAWRWAANHLIPNDALKEIYSEDFCEPWQLAEFFKVDESVVMMKLDILKWYYI
jgi:hypothetical protein